MTNIQLKQIKNILILENYLLYKNISNYIIKKNFFLDNITNGNVIFVSLFNYESFLIKKYFFLGLCIACKKKKIKSGFIIRNVIGNVLIEQYILIFSKLILNITKYKKRNIKIKKSKFYFLINLPFFFRINKTAIIECRN